MMSNLRELIPGADLWPRFVRNRSERFEARFSLVEVQDLSAFFAGMAGSVMPIAVSHGKGEWRCAMPLTWPRCNRAGWWGCVSSTTAGR